MPYRPRAAWSRRINRIDLQEIGGVNASTGKPGTYPAGVRRRCGRFGAVYARATAQSAEEKFTAIATVDGMPAVLDPSNVYSEAGAGRFSSAVSGALARVYVPEVRANRVDVIDPATFTVIDQFRAGPKPQHVIPSWDLKTLWVAGSGRRHSRGKSYPDKSPYWQTWCHHPRAGRIQYVFQPRR